MTIEHNDGHALLRSELFLLSLSLSLSLSPSLFQTQLAQSNKRLLAKKFLKSAGQLLEIVKFNKNFSLQERAPEKVKRPVCYLSGA